MAAEGMSLVSRSLRISSQMLESFDSIWVKSTAKVGCDPVLLGCDLGSVCVCVCVCVCLCVHFFSPVVTNG